MEMANTVTNVSHFENMRVYDEYQIPYAAEVVVSLKDKNRMISKYRVNTPAIAYINNIYFSTCDIFHYTI